MFVYWYSNDIGKVTGKYCTASLPFFGSLQHIQYSKMQFASCKSSTCLTIGKPTPRQFDGGHGWSAITDGEAIWGFPKMVVPTNYWFSY